MMNDDKSTWNQASVLRQKAFLKGIYFEEISCHIKAPQRILASAFFRISDSLHPFSPVSTAKDNFNAGFE